MTSVAGETASSTQNIFQTFLSNCWTNKHQKYTNPARGILDFCKQKFCRPLLCCQWTRGPQNIFKLKWRHINYDEWLLFWKYCAIYGGIVQCLGVLCNVQGQDWPLQNKLWQYCAKSRCIAQCSRSRVTPTKNWWFYPPSWPSPMVLSTWWFYHLYLPGGFKKCFHTKSEIWTTRRPPNLYKLKKRPPYGRGLIRSVTYY